MADQTTPSRGEPREDQRTHPDEGPDTATDTSQRGNGQSARVAELSAQVATLDDRWRRAVADLENLRKRMAVEVDRERSYERNRAASALLPIVDNLDLALEHAAADPRSLIQGLLAVRDQAVNALAMLGFPRRDDLGVHFDPSRHEAVGSVPGADAAPGTVVAVVRPGYGEGDRQLRPAAVVVATGGSSGEAEEGSG
ncbi:MAG: molecular chaperone GrpE [Actinomycetota bacterium]|nr:molecular chaperone GrpE [Actinomycetota bacterium]MEA2566275.1 molecular chaperone GrpE [Actinomycetota bacterium]MEA2589505.1 molecular chaperone GrpE [Actinomycetota bacterium]